MWGNLKVVSLDVGRGLYFIPLHCLNVNLFSHVIAKNVTLILGHLYELFLQSHKSNRCPARL